MLHNVTETKLEIYCQYRIAYQVSFQDIPFCKLLGNKKVLSILEFIIFFKAMNVYLLNLNSEFKKSFVWY